MSAKQVLVQEKQYITNNVLTWKGPQLHTNLTVIFASEAEPFLIFRRFEPENVL